MSYQETIDYLFSQLPMYHRVGAAAYKANLDNTVALCNLLNNPHHSFKTIHVTGTNGKGSVSHMLASILQTAGFRTGLYTSPHLKDFRERIRVNGKMIVRSYVSQFVEKHHSEFEKIQPSFFEMAVGLAFQYFKDQQVDIAVIEVGLGGRLDSTNVIQPEVSVITNVSFDHMQFLGDTLQKIAMEKAGIIKPGVPVIIGETQEEIRDLFIRQAKLLHSPIFFADQLFSISKFDLHEKIPGRSVLDVNHNGTVCFKRLISPLAGLYQKKNIVTVLAVCELLNQSGYELSNPIIRKGIQDVIKNTKLAGRWQVLNRHPLTICDTGHNEGGLTEVLAQIAQTPHRKLHFVFGVVNDKYLPPILTMLPKTARYYFCKPDIPRGLEVKELASKAHAAGLTGKCYSSVKEALMAAKKEADNEDMIYIGGSTFVVAEVI
ncbi:MAG: bifunctional folylpolyglutamate synthase/dihydrofolate synthase [Bacteroidales bacterium]|nr:bifunctional folylpolyglutamate synthase/dihydrofolate synthase [Bacteroidales bacterium]